MKTKIYFIVLCIFVLSSVFPLHAMMESEMLQILNQDKISLTVEQSIDIGLTYSRSYFASLMDVQTADAKYKETRTKLFPTLKFEGSYTRLSKIPPFEVNFELPGTEPMHFVISDSILNYYNFQLKLSQPIFTGFALENAVKASRMERLAAKEMNAKDKSQLIFDIKNAYWSLVKAMEFKKLLDENVTLVESHLNDVQRFYNQGLAKNNDVLKVQVQLSSIKVNQLEAKHRVRMAMMALNSLLGLPLEKEIEPASKLSGIDNLERDVKQEVEKAMLKRPELKAMTYNLEASKAAIKIARSGKYPQLGLEANYYMSNPNTRIMPTEKKFQDTWDISLGLSFNIWNWKSTTYQVYQADSQYRKTKALESQMKDMVTLEVQQNYFDLLQAKEKIDMSETNVTQAQENYRITNERFKAGLTPNSELLDAEVFLLQAKVSRTEAFIDYELARARLSKSTGEE